MQKPLVQSALVLLAAIILIGFVAGSEAQGVLGGISSIIKGIFYSALFAIALAVALVFSVLCLFGIFLGAVALYSPDTSKSIYGKLVQGLLGLIPTGSSVPTKAAPPVAQEVAHEETDDVAQPAVKQEIVEEVVEQESIEPQAPQTPSAELLVQNAQSALSDDISTLGTSVEQLSSKHQTLGEEVATLKSTLSELPVDEVTAKASSLETSQSELAEKLDNCLTKITSLEKLISENGSSMKQQEDSITSLQTKMDSFSDELVELRQAVEESMDEVTAIYGNHRIFNYIENEDDKLKFAELVEQAIEKDMTYAEIDTFLSESLSQDVDAIIKDHPSLTKQYIRDCKNK